MDAVKVTSETITAEQLEQLTPEQVKTLESGGEVDMNQTVPVETPATGDEETPSEPDEEKEQAADIEALKTQVKSELSAEWEKERRGITADLKAERERRRHAEQQLQEIQAQAQGKQEANNMDGLTEDDFPTVGHVRKINEEAIKKIQAQFEIEKQNLILAISARLAKERHKDYNDVLASFGEMAAWNEDLLQQVLADPDPAERAYQEGLKHPKYQAGKQNNNDLINVIKNRPKTITGGGGTRQGKITLEQAAQMSDEQWAALPPQERQRLLSGG